MFNFTMTNHTVIDHIWVYLHLVNVKIISALARKQEVLKTQLHRWKHHFKSIHKICKRTNPALNKYSVIYSFFLSEIAVVWMVATAAHQSICHLQVLVSVHKIFHGENHWRQVPISDFSADFAKGCCCWCKVGYTLSCIICSVSS